MSSIFNDKEFDKLDWLSQATEPYILTYAPILESMPDIVHFPDDFIINMILTTPRAGLSVSTVVSSMLKEQNLDFKIVRFFTEKFTIETDGQVEVDLEENTVKGKIWLRKIINTFTDKESKQILWLDFLNNVQYRTNNLSKSRVNEVGSILISKDSTFFEKKNEFRKYDQIVSFIGSQIREDIYRFRSNKAVVHFANLIHGYCTGGPEELLGLIYRIKMMIDRGQPIYSVER